MAAGADGLSIYLLQQLFLNKYRAIELKIQDET